MAMRGWESRYNAVAVVELAEFLYIVNGPGRRFTARG